MTRTRQIALAVVLAVLTAAPVAACMGVLLETRIVVGGVACTYQLSDGRRVEVLYPNRFSCPFCME